MNHDQESESEARYLRGEQTEQDDPRDSNRLGDVREQSNCTRGITFRINRADSPIRSRNPRRFRVTPSTHGGTLSLLIDDAEQHRQGLRRKLARLKGEQEDTELELERSASRLENLKALLENWQRNIEKLEAYEQGAEG